MGKSIEAIREGRASEQPARVLVLASFGVDDAVYDALCAGGPLLRDELDQRLSTTVRVVAGSDAPPSRRAPGRQGAGGGYVGGVASLTERETEVLLLVARGLTNAEIAGELFVTENTVRTHVVHVLRKLGVRDRVQAVVFAYESGLVRPAGRR